MSTSRKQLVYDIPMRLFHWLFAGLFVTAFFITKTIDDDSPTFSYHMLAGLLLGFIVLLRILWGFLGARYSLFSSFALHPKDLFSYFTGILAGDKRKWVGHNPASSWAAIIMMILALGLGITGYLMSTGYKETFEDLHELLANGFLVVALMHIAGLALHVIRHRDGLIFSMFDGAKSDLPISAVIPSSRPFIGLIFLGLVTTFSIHLMKNFDSQKRTLNFFGTTLQLGEGEDEGGKENEREGSENEDKTTENKKENENVVNSEKSSNEQSEQSEQNNADEDGDDD